jgi:hypothetical protein
MNTLKKVGLVGTAMAASFAAGHYATRDKVARDARQNQINLLNGIVAQYDSAGKIPGDHEFWLPTRMRRDSFEVAARKLEGKDREATELVFKNIGEYQAGFDQRGARIKAEDARMKANYCAVFPEPSIAGSGVGGSSSGGVSVAFGDKKPVKAVPYTRFDASSAFHHKYGSGRLLILQHIVRENTHAEDNFTVFGYVVDGNDGQRYIQPVLPSEKPAIKAELEALAVFRKTRPVPVTYALTSNFIPCNRK